MKPHPSQTCYKLLRAVSELSKTLFFRGPLGTEKGHSRNPGRNSGERLCWKAASWKVPLNATRKEPAQPDSSLVLISSQWRLSFSELGSQGEEFGSLPSVSSLCLRPHRAVHSEPSCCFLMENKCVSLWLRKFSACKAFLESTSKSQ